MSTRVYIFDTTLRDGEQTPGVSLNAKEKLEIAKQIAKMGVDAIEAGFPIASNGDFEAVKLISQNVKGPYIVALARANKNDIDRAYEAIKYSEKPRIHTFIATSDIHMEYKLKMSKEEVLKKAVEMTCYAKSLVGSVEFSPEDASRTDREFLYEVLEAVIEAGADVVNIPDTVGYSTPREFGGLIKDIEENVKNIDKAIISVHCHNDLGLATSNSLSAIENGARQIECTVNGLGERAGNAAVEEVIMALKTRKDIYDFETGVITELITRTSSLVSNLTGVTVQSNKAIVGCNAFSHESGIHQHGVLSKRETYEIMTPESVGLRENVMVLGKHSGRHAFEDRLNTLGYENLSKDIINNAFKKFKDLADKKKTVTDEDIEALIREDFQHINESVSLEYFLVSTGSIISTATVKVKNNEEIVKEAACGDGPVDAAFKAIDKCLGENFHLKDYYLKAIGSGQDALGEVTVKIENSGNIYQGRGISIDVIEASVKAYINAINKVKNN